MKKRNKQMGPPKTNPFKTNPSLVPVLPCELPKPKEKKKEKKVE
jgi:hypothetical protein